MDILPSALYILEPVQIGQSVRNTSKEQESGQKDGLTQYMWREGQVGGDSLGR